MENPQNTDRHELELFDRRHKKLSGTSLVLCDQDYRFVYKIIPEYTTSEATFYCLINGYPAQDNPVLYECLHGAIKRPDKLAQMGVLPAFKGVVKVVEEEHDTSETKDDDEHCSLVRYFEGEGILGVPKTVFTAIKLENLLHGYERPAVIDIKLGIHNTLDNEQYGGLDAATRAACVKRWQDLKTTHKLEHMCTSSTKRLYNISAEDLGMGPPFSDMEPTELHSLLKSWRQKIVASQTPEVELGFRVCSIYIAKDDGVLEVSASQAKLLKQEDTVNILHTALSSIPEVRQRMVDALVGLRDWVAMQDLLSFAATSLLITYDQKEPTRCRVKWVDFTHVESIRHSQFSVVTVKQALEAHLVVLLENGRHSDAAENEASSATDRRGPRHHGVCVVGDSAEVFEQVHSDEFHQRAQSFRVAVDGKEHAEAVGFQLSLVGCRCCIEQSCAFLACELQFANHYGLEPLFRPLQGAAQQWTLTTVVAHVLFVVTIVNTGQA
ncbi:hypothetical protein, conserved [Babesia ovata]|uniref:Kinase n=1 Tax=Babesia ovata TaxID=189622 RepID=A0A2H6K8X0_9APIC|nr:uncharacterized protein BOVATA_009390 [Babesia ovata]GBE59446.1 hypothetical protein, conserved [Babesia ovata]